MMHETIFKFLGLAMVLISWFAGLYLTRKWRGTRAMSISQHAASADGASRLFAVVLVGGGTIFYLWLLLWFKPHLRLSTLFTTLLTVTMVAQIVSGVIPDTDNWKRFVHRMAAYGMAVLYLPLGYLIVVAPAASATSKVIGVVCLLYMVGAGLTFLFVKRARPHYLIAQALYIVAFQLIILSAAYIR